MKKKSNASAVAFFAVIIVGGLFYYTWKFIIPTYSQNRAESVALDVSIADANKKLESLKKAQTTLTQLGDIPEKLSVSVPEDNDMPNLITELEAVAARHGMVLPSIGVSDGTALIQSTGTESAGSSASSVTISIASLGSFEDISAFMTDLENDVRFMNIKSVSIGTVTDSSGASSMSVALQIEAYKRTATSPDGASGTTTGQ